MEDKQNGAYIDHSLKGYLERQSTETLMGILKYCTESDRIKEYDCAMQEIMRLLQRREFK